MKFAEDRKQFPAREEEIMEFWKKEKIFEKSVSERPEDNAYVFYDGPPFATGLPHYGHIVASTLKDIFPRYQTMRGHRVERRWGWDCHGLPIENLVEKELNLNSRKDIEEYGIDKFSEACRSKVLLYANEWKKIIPRLGRWVEMDDDYKTMDPQFMESVWWVFKSLYDKKFVYEGYKSMHICPRCETTLSNFEVTQGYVDVFDISVTCKFELWEKIDDQTAYLLAWTTTPWTLPGNVALAVGSPIDYAIWKMTSLKNGQTELVIFANALESKVLGFLPGYSEGNKQFVTEFPKIKGKYKFELIRTIKGVELEGKKYKPLFDYFVHENLPNKENLYQVVTADFVSTEEGTGVVHIAPAFGEDDLNLGNKKNLSFIQHVTPDGKFIDLVNDFAGEEVKPKGDPSSTDSKIIGLLDDQGKVFQTAEYEHSYPHCWRCDTPLLNYATSSWFVKVTDIKERMIELNENINWMPAHLKHGRFGKWLENARDWSISRTRYWGNPMPVWKCTCGEVKVLGSKAELEELSGQKIDDLHKHVLDKIMFPCKKCGGAMQRIPEVFDCWMESGSMPYAQVHYPFENKEKFEKNFPAEFIAEGVDQTRAWFYVLHILSSMLFDSNCFKNVVVNGIVLAEDGQKMAKSKKNYPDPMAVVDKYGSDALRFYLMSSPVVRAEDLRFSEKGVDEVYKKVILLALNVLSFYKMYEPKKKDPGFLSEDILDIWIVSKLNQLISEVTKQFDAYDLNKALKPMADFINDLSTWYLRRSRERIKGGTPDDKNAALQTLYQVLLTFSKVIAPVMPFMSELIYDRIGGEKKSVHLEDWPQAVDRSIDRSVLLSMDKVKEIVEIGLAIRQMQKVKVRQALLRLQLTYKKLAPAYLDIIKDELNVKNIEIVDDLTYGDSWRTIEDSSEQVALDVAITPELKKEGLMREIIRSINNLRKNSGLTISDKVNVYFQTASSELSEVLQAEEYKNEILKKTIAQDIISGKGGAIENFSAELSIDGQLIWFGLSKI
ncbi:MAG: isoleucine--tRNA ligase [Patescibacteria group bacterium]